MSHACRCTGHLHHRTSEVNDSLNSPLACHLLTHWTNPLFDSAKPSLTFAHKYQLYGFGRGMINTPVLGDLKFEIENFKTLLITGAFVILIIEIK